MDPDDLLNESVVRLDGDGVVRGWNRGAAELYGIARVFALGRALPEVVQEPEAQWRQRLADGDRWAGEVTRMTAAGPVLVQARWAARRDARGAVCEIVETSRAMPELADLRQQARTATHRFENLFQALAVSFFETDFRRVGSELKRLRDSGVEDLRAYLLAHPQQVRALMDLEDVLDVNAASVKLFAAGSAADLRGNRSGRYWSDESIPDYVGALIAVMDKQPHFVCETRLRALDGTPIDALFTVAWSPESAKRGIMVVGVIDLRDQKRALAEVQRSEEKFRRLFNAMSIGLLEYDFAKADLLLARYRSEGVVDLERHLLADPARMHEMIDAMRVGAINQRALDIFGLDESDVQPSGIGWLWPSESWGVVACAVDGRYRKQLVPPQDHRVRRPDGREIDVTITLWVAPERRSDQPVLCGVVDISERLAAQQHLEMVRNEFAHASRIATLGELAASVAHEISQPLSAIITNAGTAIRSLDHDPPRLQLLRPLAERTLGAANRAAGIVARIRSVVAPVAAERTPLSLATMVTEALPFVRHELKQSRVELTLRLADGAPSVAGDRVQLQQVVVNLVLNAVQAMQDVPTGERRLAITTAQDGDRLVLTVEDSGLGFDPADHQRMFNSFYTTKPSGMGIGLAICRSIVEAHGGTITATALARGARFMMSLPFLRVSSFD